MKDTVKQSTYASYRSYLNKHFVRWGNPALKKLEPHTLQEFYNYKFHEEGFPKTFGAQLPRPCATTTWHCTNAYNRP